MCLHCVDHLTTASGVQGSPYAVVSILDTIRAISAPVSTVAFGIVGGTATTVLAAGAKGRRFSMQNTRILLQQPMGGLQGSAGARSCRVPQLLGFEQLFCALPHLHSALGWRGQRGAAKAAASGHLTS